MQVGVDALPLAARHLIDAVGDAIEGEARVRVQGHPGEGMGSWRAAVADDGEAVIHRLVSGALEFLPQEVVDEGGLAGREGSQDGDQGPPGDLGGVGLFFRQEAHAMGDLVELSETLD